MGTIRRLNCFDRPKIKKMISYLGGENEFSKALMREAFIMLSSFLPLKYRRLPESYILLDDGEIQGLITVVPTNGNPYKINITRLIFRQNYYDVGKQLIEFVIARYGAQGAISFSVLVDESHDELLELFTAGCGFRQCSCECLWKLENTKSENKNPHLFRYCQKSDAKAVSRLFNGELVSLYRPSLDRTKEEYQEPTFAGFASAYKNRYVMEEPAKGRIIGYISITTEDNVNFVIDLSTNEGYDISYNDVLDFALSEISRRKTVFYAFVKQKKYTKTSDRLEEYLRSHNADLIQTQVVLVKDFYRPIKQSESILQVFLFGETGNAT